VDDVWQLPETISVMLLSGLEDVQVHVAVPNSEHLRRIVLSSIASFPGVVDERALLVFEHRRKVEVGVLHQR
jgi:DNA-binding Lrp family transcriptional regulator